MSFPGTTAPKMSSDGDNESTQATTSGSSNGGCGSSIFDKEIDRRQVPSLKYSRMVLGETLSEADELFVAGVADMDFAIAPCIQEALQQRMIHPVLGYETAPEGLYPAVCEWMHKRHNWCIEPQYILRAPNVLNALSMAVNAFTQHGDGILVQPPVFFDFFDIIAENQRTPVLNPLLLDKKKDSKGRYTMDFDHLEKVAAQAKMMFLCNPHNPVGRVWTRQELETLTDICQRHNILIVSDEVHGDLCFPTAKTKFTPLATLCPDDCITLSSPAKTFNIAACCSSFTIIPNPHLRQAMQAENSRLTVSKNNAFASVAMEAAYRDGEGWLDAALDYLTGNVHLLRERLKTSIPSIQLVEPEGTFLLWLDCRILPIDDSDGYALRQWFRSEALWTINRGAAFGIQGHGFVRVNIACPRRKLAQALDRLEVAVKKLEANTVK